MEEEWRGVVGFEERYSVSNLGRVRNHSTGKPLKPQDSYGYKYVGLSLNGFQRRKAIHRLVMESFVGPSDLLVNHIDKDPSNNRLDNLEYVTYRENSVHGALTKNDGLPAGVSLMYDCGKVFYAAQIHLNGARRYLGRYWTIKEASSAYIEALKKADKNCKYLEQVMEQHNALK